MGDASYSVLVPDIAPEGDVPGGGRCHPGRQFGGGRCRELRLSGRDVAPSPASLEVSNAEVAVLPAGGGVLPAAQQFLKSMPELRTKYCIDDWVQSRVEIT